MAKYPEQKLEKDWIQSPITTEVIEWTESFAEALVKVDLTTSQIRRFFGEVKRIAANFKNNKSDIVMLKPMLAYAAARKKNQTKILYEELTEALNAIREDDKFQENDFKNFVQIFESIVAYHKYHGGKE